MKFANNIRPQPPRSDLRGDGDPVVERSYRFFVQEGDGPEVEVGLSEYRNMESRAGFRPKSGMLFATASFSSTSGGLKLRGRVEYIS